MSNNTAKLKDAFNQGIAYFRAQKYEDALEKLTKAIALGGTQDATIYDSRAAVYEKLGRAKDALMDSKHVISIAPERWQGYARSARLFSSIHKYDSALRMINLALERVPSGDQKRRAELESRRSEIEADQADYLERQRRHASKTFYHFGRLPIEIASAIFSNVVESDPTQAIRLSHVCRDWRQVVLEMPSLWFYLSLSDRSPKARAKAWKERSRGKIKALSIHGEKPQAMYALEILDDMPFHHLRALSLISVDWANLRQTLPLLTNDVIRELDAIHIDQMIWIPGVDWFFEVADLKVRELVVTNADVNWRSLSDNCQNLTTLYYHGWFHQEYVADLLALLYRNPGIERLSLNMAIKGPIMFSLEQERRYPLPKTFSVLPKLVELSLEGSELVPDSLIAALVPSKLQVLRLTKCLGSLDQSLKHLLARHYAPHLRELVIDRCVIRDPHVLVEILDGAASLQNLSLKYLYNIRPVLDALSEPVEDSEGTSRVLLPKLAQLDLSHCTEVRDGAVIRIVKLRISPPPQDAGQDTSNPPADNTTTTSQRPPQLTSLILHGCDVSADILPWLRQYVPKVESRWATKKQANWKR